MEEKKEQGQPVQLSEEEGKAVFELFQKTDRFLKGEETLPFCAFCRYYKVNIRKIENDTALATSYCSLTGKGVGQNNRCDFFAEKNSEWEKENKLKNEFLCQYIQPLEYEGLIGGVLETPHGTIRLFMAEEIEGNKIMITIYENIDVDEVVFEIVDSELRPAKDGLWDVTYISTHSKFEGYGEWLENKIKEILKKFKEELTKKDN